MALYREYTCAEFLFDMRCLVLAGKGVGNNNILIGKHFS
jgi:hypothetical protein